MGALRALLSKVPTVQVLLGYQWAPSWTSTTGADVKYQNEAACGPGLMGLMQTPLAVVASTLVPVLVSCMLYVPVTWSVSCFIEVGDSSFQPQIVVRGSGGQGVDALSSKLGFGRVVRKTVAPATPTTMRAAAAAEARAAESHDRAITVRP
jgi:hypothetical protein